MLANMASSLILQKRISTTLAKAKALRVYVEPLLTKSKNDSTHSRRMVFSYLKDKDAVSEMFREVSPKIAERPGGYTRILKTGSRLGDNADMCIIELVDYNENMLTAPAETKDTKKRSRRRRGKKGGTPDTSPAAEQKLKSAGNDKISESSSEGAVDEKAESTDIAHSADEGTASGEAAVEIKEETPAEDVKQETPASEEKKKEETPASEEKKEETPASEEVKEEAPADKTKKNPSKDEKLSDESPGPSSDNKPE